MDTGFDKAKLLHYKALLTRHLGDPVRLRLAVVVALTGLALGAGYVPLSGTIQERRRLLAAEAHRAESIRDVEALRKQIELYRDRLGGGSDTNEWVQYLLGGLRRHDVKLRDMESREPQRIGPYRAVVLTVVVEGPYAQLKQFIEWLEQSDRLLRIDSMRLERRAGDVSVKIVLLGLIAGKQSASES